MGDSRSDAGSSGPGATSELAGSMVERVAIAIEPTAWIPGSTSGYSADHDDAERTKAAIRDRAKLQAKAAITAMREPTDAMKRAGEQAADQMSGDTLEMFAASEAGDVWQAMIDAALA